MRALVTAAAVPLALALIACGEADDEQTRGPDRTPTAEAPDTPAATTTEAPPPGSEPEPEPTVEPPEPPPEPEPEPATFGYVIEPGDTLSGIAEAFQVPPDALRDANPGLDPRALTIGDVLSVPIPAGGVALPDQSFQYVVAPGDTFFGIAQLFGLTVEQIQNSNPNVASQAIPVGARLTIPGAGAPPPSPDGPITDPDAALAAFVETDLGHAYIGSCEQYSDPAATPEGYCSIELHRTAELVTFQVGPPFSEVIGEVVLTANQDGSWSVSFVPAGPPGESVSVGSQAVIFGAGTCLNFRQNPGLSATVLSCRIDGTTGLIVDGPVQADGHTWWLVEGLGWASGQYLRPAQ